MGQSASKEKVALTSHKKAEQQTYNGRNEKHKPVNESAQEKTANSVLNTDTSESALDSSRSTADAGENSASPKLTKTEKRESKKSQKEEIMREKTAETQRASMLTKRTSFYETVDASEILPHLMIGNKASSTSEEFLARKNVQYILSLTSEPTESEVEGIEYKKVIMEDDEDEELIQHFETCFNFIDKAKSSGLTTKGSKRDKKRKPALQEQKVVLVHSFFGISRASAIVLAYLMKEKEWTLREAYDHLKEKHPSTNPNDHFIVQLLHYEQELYDGKMTMTLKDFYH